MSDQKNLRNTEKKAVGITGSFFCSENPIIIYYHQTQIKYSILKVIETNGNPYTGPADQRFNLSRGLNQLKGMGQLFKEKNGYILTDPLVEYFIKTRVLRMSF